MVVLDWGRQLGGDSGGVAVFSGTCKQLLPAGEQGTGRLGEREEQVSADYGPQVSSSLCCGLCLWVKLYWNSAMLVHLHTTSGCFCKTTAESSICDRSKR